MASAVVPDPTFSALYDDASKWTHPTVDYEYYTECVGAPTPVTGNTMDRPTDRPTTIMDYVGELSDLHSNTHRLHSGE